MDFDFKKCEHYEEALAKEHCPFDSVCKDKCFFTLHRQAEENEGFFEEYNELEQNYFEAERRISELKDDLEDQEHEYTKLQREKDKLELKVVRLTNYCKQLIEDLSKYEKGVALDVDTLEVGEHEIEN